MPNVLPAPWILSAKNRWQRVSVPVLSMRRDQTPQQTYTPFDTAARNFLLQLFPNSISEKRRCPLCYCLPEGGTVCAQNSIAGF